MPRNRAVRADSLRDGQWIVVGSRMGMVLADYCQGSALWIRYPATGDGRRKVTIGELLAPDALVEIPELEEADDD